MNSLQVDSYTLQNISIRLYFISKSKLIQENNYMIQSCYQKKRLQLTDMEKGNSGSSIHAGNAGER